MDPNLFKIFNTVPDGDAAVIAAIVAGGKTLVIRQPDRDDPLYKFAGGTVEKGETIFDALIREIADETGYALPLEPGEETKPELYSESVRVEFLACEPIKFASGSHDQYQFLIIVRDERDILYLDGKLRKEDDEETIETKVLELSTLEQRRDFLWKQLKMLRRAKARLAEIAQPA